MKIFKLACLCAVAACMAAVVMFSVNTRATNALIDGNGKPTTTVEDNATANTIMRLKGDVTTGALIVSGIGLSACSTPEIDKTTFAATTAGTISASATATWFVILAESTNAGNLYWSNSAAPTATTGVETLPATGWGIPARLKNIYVYNAGASQATATVIWCY